MSQGDAGSRRAGSKVARGLLLILLGGFLLFSWRSHPDFGVTFDEVTHLEYGRDTADYFLSLGQAGKAGEDPFAGGKKKIGPAMPTAFGPLYELPVECWAFFTRLGFQDHLRARHFWNAMWGLAALAAVAGAAWRLGGAWAGLLAALLLAFSPRFFGHAFNNMKDIPFAAAWAGAMWAGLASLESLARRGRFNWLVLGLGMAAAVLVRPNGLAAAFLVGGAMSALVVLSPWDHPEEPGPNSRLLANGYRFALALLSVFLLSLAIWPVVQQNPLGFMASFSRRAAEAAEGFMAPPATFLGKGTLPARWVYIPGWLWATLPPVTLVMMTAGMAWLAGFFWRAGRAWLGARRRAEDRSAAGLAALDISRAVLMAGWTLGLPAYLMLTNFPFYDGIRHLLFVQAGLCVLAGVAAAGIGRWLRDRRPRWLKWSALALMLALLEPAWAMWRLHPLQVVYFSPLVGGLAGVENRLELDYWGSSGTLAARWLTARTTALGRPVTAKVSHPVDAFRFGSGGHLDILMAERAADRPADFYLALRRWDMEKAFPEAPVIHRVERDGVTLAVVKQLRPVAGMPWPPRGEP